MNSRNEKSKTQGELSARPVRQRPALMLTFLTLLGLILEACGSTATKITPAMETPCPDAVQQLVDPQVIPDLEISVAVDGSGSFMGDRSASRAFVAQQVALAVDDAVDRAAALRVIVFGGSAGNARTVVECSVMAVGYRNEAARPAKTAYLKQVARDHVWDAVLSGRPPMAQPGTSVVGGYVALADAARLTVGRREALMLSDGIALPEMAVAADLSGFSSIGMYGVGQTEPPPSTHDVVRLARSWQAWLALQGARQVVVSTQGYSSKVRAAP
ncbi:MAG TPA: hypothetical protein VF086_09265 [Propionibacteriaceae bacterium]